METGEEVMEYLMADNETCLKMVYNVEGEEDEVTILFVSTSDKKIRKFDTENGTEIEAFEVENNVVFMEGIAVSAGNLLIGMT